MKIRKFEEHVLHENYDKDLKIFKILLIEKPELSVLPLHLSPNGKPISKIYRTVKQPDFFDDIYGTGDQRKDGRPIVLKYVYADQGKPGPIPSTRKMILSPCESDNTMKNWDLTTDWTIDSAYYYQVHDECIRICLDFEKLKEIVGKENILNLLYDREGEIRVRVDIPLLSVLDHIEITREHFENDVEGEYGIDRAVKTWYPKELMPFLKLNNSYWSMSNSSYNLSLEKYYNELYSKYGTRPIKPYGNTWIDQS